MKHVLGTLVVLALVATPALAQKVHIDYAHEYDFDSVATFQYVDTDESNSTNPLMAGRIEALIKSELIEGGLTEVTENPDIYVTYHIASEQMTSFNTTHFGYGGYGRGWRGWGAGLGSSTTRQTDYTVGTLIIDAYEGESKEMVWRGTGTVTVKNAPEKQVRQVEKILHKLGNRWDKILAGKGK